MTKSLTSGSNLAHGTDQHLVKRTAKAAWACVLLVTGLLVCGVLVPTAASAATPSLCRAGLELRSSSTLEIQKLRALSEHSVLSFQQLKESVFEFRRQPQYSERGEVLLPREISYSTLTRIEAELQQIRNHLLRNFDGIASNWQNKTNPTQVSATISKLEQLLEKTRSARAQNQVTYRDYLIITTHFPNFADLPHQFRDLSKEDLENYESYFQAAMLHQPAYLTPGQKYKNLTEPMLLLPTFTDLDVRPMIEMAGVDVYFFGLTTERHSYDGFTQDALPSTFARHDYNHFRSGRISLLNARPQPNGSTPMTADNPRLLKFLAVADHDITDPEFRDLVMRVVFYYAHEQNVSGFQPKLILNQMSKGGVLDLTNRLRRKAPQYDLGTGMRDEYTTDSMIADARRWITEHLEPLR